MPFTPIPQYSDNDAFDLTDLNTFISNLNYLNESRVSMKFNAYGLNETTGIKIAAGTTASSNRNQSSDTRWITVGTFFTPGTFPVINASLATLTSRWSWISVANRSRSTVIPDHTGFSVFLGHPNIDDHKRVGPDYINWVMIGA